MSDWSNCKNILCIRADNMGDLLMSTPAIRALKNSYQCKITVLTSTLGAGIAPLIPEIDEILIQNLPWVKFDSVSGSAELLDLIQLLKTHEFDGCVIFNVYSQNPLPSAMIAYLSGIPLRLAYCRENPYALLSDWLPDREPYEFIRHQVSRDLVLVRSIGASSTHTNIEIKIPDPSRVSLEQKLKDGNLDASQPFLILHPGVSEQKRKCPSDLWVDIAVVLRDELKMQVFITGAESDKAEAEQIAAASGDHVHSLAGWLNIPEFAALIDHAEILVSVNTGSVHIASAVKTPVVVLYANSNPQHTPWAVSNKVLPYSVPFQMRSKNKVIEYVDQLLYTEVIPVPKAAEVLEAVRSILPSNNSNTAFSTSA